MTRMNAPQKMKWESGNHVAQASCFPGRSAALGKFGGEKTADRKKHGLRYMIFIKPGAATRHEKLP